MVFRVLTIAFMITLSIEAQHQAEPTDKELGVWRIEKGIFIDSDNPKNEKAKEIWKIFYGIFPKSITQEYIKQLVLFTDGPEEKTGAVVALNENNKEWQLMLDIADVDLKSNSKERVRQSIYTLIHEFGHLITLNSTQVVPLKDSIQKADRPYVTFEGETLSDSYINMFVGEYWDGALLKEWDFIRKKYCFIEQDSCLEQLYGLYEANYTDFLTDYAAESPEEDIVESWTAFVLRNERYKSPKITAYRKVNFFYQFPDLVKYRRIIRKNIQKFK